jgi:hypothetical protein
VNWFPGLVARMASEIEEEMQAMRVAAEVYDFDAEEAMDEADRRSRQTTDSLRTALRRVRQERARDWIRRL